MSAHLVSRGIATAVLSLLVFVVAKEGSYKYFLNVAIDAEYDRRNQEAEQVTARGGSVQEFLAVSPIGGVPPASVVPRANRYATYAGLAWARRLRDG
jgi:hypothetical protein